jgi:hypothetical protein
MPPSLTEQSSNQRIYIYIASISLGSKPHQIATVEKEIWKTICQLVIDADAVHEIHGLYGWFRICQGNIQAPSWFVQCEY